MWPSNKMQATIQGKRYRVETATLIAHNCYWDGNNFERSGTNQFLYRTPRGNYFVVYLTQWQGQRDEIEPIDVDAARELYEDLPEKVVELDVAFPGVVIEEA